MSASPPVSVEVDRVHKSFRLPLQHAITLKERAVHPFTPEQYRELKVLDDISFEVARGEFFGVVGRNASGKSTLLKLIASVYRADAGRIRVAGAVAPVIELGVGFQGQLTARENILLNALMMGLTTGEAKRRIDAIIEFAELQDYVHMKLMNYSTGMRARLAFAIAMQTNPDILLLDEVLAVGDAPFQKRCEEAFDEFRQDRKRTVLLVTHSMAQIEKYCDRAMLLENGRIERLGDPRAVGVRYEQLQSAAIAQASGAVAPEAGSGSALGPLPDFKPSPAEISAVQLVDGHGHPSDNVKSDEVIRLRASVRSSESVKQARLGLRITNDVGATVFQPPAIDLLRESGKLGRDSDVTATVRIKNQLTPGRYALTTVVATGPKGLDQLVSNPAIVHFEVPEDGREMRGSVSLDYDFQVADGTARRSRRKSRA